MASNYVSKISTPGIVNPFSIAHSTIATCITPAGTGAKVVSGVSTGDDIVDGFTIHVFFTEGNLVFNNQLTLTVGNITKEIVSSLIKNESQPTFYAYPKQEPNTIVTFVYKTVDTSTGTPQVQMATNMEQVPVYNTLTGADDLNQYIREGIYSIANFSSLSSTFPVSGVGGMMEVINIGGQVIQRATITTGDLYQRYLADYGSGSSTQSAWRGQNVLSVANVSAVPSLTETVSPYTKVFSYIFPSAGIFHICYGHGEASNQYGNGVGILRCFLGSDQLMEVRVDSDSSTSSANIQGNQNPYDREFNVTEGQEFSMYKQENYVEGQSGGGLSGYMAVTGYFKPTV